MTKFFRLNDNLELPGRWHLSDVVTITGSSPDLLGCQRFGEDPGLSAEVSRSGRILDFSLTSFGVPIATRRLSNAIASAAGNDVQVLTLTVSADTHALHFTIPHSIRAIECLDEQRSDFLKWTDQDDRPDLVGQFRMVTKLTIDPAAIPADANFFRVARWPIVLVVSGLLKNAMEQAGCLGARFEEIG